MSNRHLWLVQAFTRGMADRRFGRIVFHHLRHVLGPATLGAARLCRQQGRCWSHAHPGRHPRRRRHRRVRRGTRPDRHPGLPRREHRRTVRRNGAPPGDWARRPCFIDGVVHVSARPGIEPAGGMAAYSASKDALVHLTGAMRGEYRSADGRCSGRANHQDPVTPPHRPGGNPGSDPLAGREFQQRIDVGEPAPGVLPNQPQPKGDPP